ncbi:MULTISPECIES: orotidine-5'-phosphate decarboxylase [unclassified Arthrobacter]|uniref:orotidine-5'-phosphate decarboxylase n=1 Tax=unclassified Arthrobacter TaxID=235627 RepID=UPI0014910FA7|nr:MULTISPECIES: orotidine-5'-phosphate decarboxylase [unclassified Arthrobacter]MBE0009822.1 orotidine-5'-phosphate decarboxylase [Arthrobacter sp. AET 35A]NOJ63678.1 orotidine-5'-phosphate decarboxylase [Arthrobacter sp. 147(2020)]
MPLARPSFGVRLAARMQDRGGLCVGIDPHPALLRDWGLADDAAGCERFALTVLEAVGGTAAILKPQVALFERHGSAGMAALERLLADAADQGVLTIADAKRGDIGSTMAAYADAWLRDGSALAADAVTLNPYLGFESLRPALDLAAATGRGVFVLALTSNPEGASIQHAHVTDRTGGSGADGSTSSHTSGQAVARLIADAAARENRDAVGLGSVGLVVGATAGAAVRTLGLDLAELNGPILAPGIGAQGAGRKEIADTFGSALPLVLGSASRSILRAGPDSSKLRTAAEQALAELRN